MISEGNIRKLLTGEIIVDTKVIRKGTNVGIVYLSKSLIGRTVTLIIHPIETADKVPEE